MPLPPEPLLPPSRRKDYPHLSKGDTELVGPFLDKYGYLLEAVQYDVHVGQGAEIPPETNQLYAQDFTTLTQRRIDLLAHTKDEIWIVELKRSPGLTAIGQLIGYRALYLKDFKPEKKIRLLLIADSMTPDIAHVAESQNITWNVLTPETL